MSFPFHPIPTPAITAHQMAEIDRLMIEEYHITLLHMMENAGRALAHLARRRFLGGDPRGRRVTILAGVGGNGGGALTAGRRLHNYGAQVTVYLTRPADQLTPATAHQMAILQRLGVTAGRAGEPDSTPPADLVLDGILGYSLQGAPRGGAANLIAWADAQPAPILALDLPSGVDATTGQVYAPAIQAAATLTLAWPKAGLLTLQAAPQVGELYLADISVPPVLYTALGIQADPIFALSDIVRLV